MNAIKPPLGHVESILTRRSTSDRQRSARVAYRFFRSKPDAESSSRQEPSERLARVAELSQQIKSGTYRPNLELVAERLVGAIGRSRRKTR